MAAGEKLRNKGIQQRTIFFRSCIAKTIAETSLMMFTIRLFSQFRVRWEGGDLDYVTVPINKPDKPLRLNFSPRGK